MVLITQGEYQKVIDQLEGKPNLSARERNYLAAAYSQAGGIDVFSLYSVLEIQLFHKNVLQWDSIAQEKHPYRRFLETDRPSTSDQAVRQERQERLWQTRRTKIIRSKKLKIEKPSFESVQAMESTMTLEAYEALHAQLLERVNIILAMYLQDEIAVELEWISRTYDMNHNRNTNPGRNAIWHYYFDNLRLEYL